ncbi:hypothetical protein B0H12DRAFT_1132408 [Mycena haematopus]|nr:hypothetical protein B0H12DRAFT_1132408 [Mycena haematopus]
MNQWEAQWLQVGICGFTAQLGCRTRRNDKTTLPVDDNNHLENVLLMWPVTIMLSIGQFLRYQVLTRNQTHMLL